MSSDTTPSKPYPDLFEELAAKIASRLIERGIVAEIAGDVGKDCAEYIRRDWGGHKMYVPKGDSYDRSLRDQQIAERWNGRNTRELCVEFRVSETTIRRAATKPRRQ